jgi:tRNA A37 threonylcarbamoyladenosine dehydratase
MTDMERYPFSRTRLLLGEEAMETLARTKVAVFGLGGVGGYCVEALARCGIGGFMLCDGDVVCTSNINRQIIATVKTVGKPKAELMRDRILEINPITEVVIFKTFYTVENAAGFDFSGYDYIIDAIDMVSSKLVLAEHAAAAGKPIISSMGAGNKLDPTRFEIADIYETSVCPLAKVMRRELRKRGIPALKVLYSKEPPIKPKADNGDSGCPDSAAGTGRDGAPARRKQVPGSISFVPSVAGLIIAGEVISDLLRAKA